MVLGLAPKRPLIVTASNTEVPVVRITDYQSGQSRNLAMPNLPVLARFSGEGNTLVTIHGFKHEVDQYEFRLLVWDADTGQLKTDRVLKRSPSRRIPELSERFAVSPDGVTYTRVSDQDVTTLQLRDMATGKVILEMQTEDGVLGYVTFSPDGKRVISTPTERSGRMKVWDSETGDLVATMNGHRAHVTSMSFKDEGRTLVSTSADHTIRLWSVETGEPLGMLRGHNEEVRAGIMHPDGKTFLSGSFDGEILVWRPSSMDRSSHYQQIQKIEKIELQRGRRRGGNWTYAANGQSIVAMHRDGHLYRHSGQDFQLSQRITDAPLSKSIICFGPNGK